MHRQVFAFLLVFLFSLPAFALGTYSHGWAVVKIEKLESSGLIFDSYEGVLQLHSFNSDEKCDEKKDQCFTGQPKKLNFSVQSDNTAANFINKNIGREILVNYRIHRFEPIALSTDFEVIEAKNLLTEKSKDLKEKLVVKKTGSERNFSVAGKILQLDYQGTFIGTYEGLYLDKKKNKVHPFSITNEKMAKYAWQAMQSRTSFYMGISVAYATGFRKSDYDIFEINYKEPAGGVSVSSLK